jgi:hypothetical protein
MISVNIGSNLANQLWEYAVCRTVAEYKNYEFHIARDWLGTEFFDCSLGVELDLTTRNFHVDEGGEQQKYNPEVWNISDFTKMYGHLQTEKYIINNKRNIQKWFTLKRENINLYNHMNIDDNTCVIHFRGTDYKNNPILLLNRQYYTDSIRHMLVANPNMKFIVVTDDPEVARHYFPEYPVYSNARIDDYYIMNRARYLIIANSTFSWWAAWLNDNCRFVIAPKYWFRHNISNGWWCVTDSITTGFYYVDRAGEIFSSNQCLRELQD